MVKVAVRILHVEPASDAGPLERWLATARGGVAQRHRAAFLVAGADDVRIAAGPPDGMPFGARLRLIAREVGDQGLIVLGSGAIPLASARDYRAFVEASASKKRRALANNRYSADVIAVSRADALADVPDLPSDNALPRWLEEVAGFEVTDVRRRWRMAIDLDSPLDIVLTRVAAPPPPIDVAGDLGAVGARLRAVAAVAADRRAELVVAGRTSAAILSWLERNAAARIRALIEERGLRASSRLALAGEPASVDAAEVSSAQGAVRPPRSVLGLLLDADGPGAIGSILAQLGDAAIVDTRVLMAHRLGVDERAWPSAEERFASDLLLPDRVHDGWLRELTAAAAAAPIPILLGGHSLVGPGVRLVLRASAWSRGAGAGIVP